MNFPNPAIDMKTAEALMNPTASAIAGYRSPRMNCLFSKKSPTLAGSFTLLWWCRKNSNVLG
jgi:hypothetical protein